MEFIPYLVGAPAISKRWLGGNVYSARSASTGSMRVVNCAGSRPRGMLVGSLVKLLVGEKSSSWAGHVDFRYP